jgi:hypothetical protein
MHLHVLRSRIKRSGNAPHGFLCPDIQYQRNQLDYIRTPRGKKSRNQGGVEKNADENTTFFGHDASQFALAMWLLPLNAN